MRVETEVSWEDEEDVTLRPRGTLLHGVRLLSLIRDPLKDTTEDLFLPPLVSQKTQKSAGIFDKL